MSNELQELANLANAIKIDDELSSHKEWRQRGGSNHNEEYEELEYNEEEVETELEENEFPDLLQTPKKARRTPVSTTSRSLITTIDGLTQLGRPWINAKFKKKISENDWDRIYDLEDEDNSKITEADMKLLERVARLKKESSEFADQLRFTKQDYDDLMQATELMVEETGFDMPPSMPFFIEIAKKLGERAVMISTI